MKNINNEITQLAELQEKIQNNNSTTEDLLRANDLAELLIGITKETYNKTSEKYTEIRKISDIDKRTWDKLMYYIHTYSMTIMKLNY